MKHPDSITGSLLFLTALWICFESVGFGLGTWASPGPGFLPFGAGMTLGILSLVLLIRNARGRNSAHFEDPSEKIRWVKWAVTLGALLGYAFLIESLGYILCTFLFIFVLLIYVEPKRWIRAIAVSVAATAGTHFIFVWLLKADLPKGILW